MEVTLYVTDMLENRLTIVNGYDLTLPLSLIERFFFLNLKFKGKTIFSHSEI